MQYAIFGLIISLFLTSCGRTDTKQKELRQKEKEFVVKERELQFREKGTQSPVKDSPGIIQQPIQKGREQLWSEFWGQFSFAVNHKDKKKLIELSITGKEFFDGIDVITAAQWINVADSQTWLYLQKTVNKGTKTFEKTKKISKDDHLIFECISNKWVWIGIMGH